MPPTWTQCACSAWWPTEPVGDGLLPAAGRGRGRPHPSLQPQGELPFAGHPSVCVACAAAELGLATPRDGMLIQQCDAGLLPVRIDTHADGRHALGTQSTCRRRDTVPPPRDEPATWCKR
ncbi:PhzF family phenazine biosynthesis protein [Xanthomonas sacchari]|uniref:PhzF family phenazine biosynthesis protein n=1 Tax=Xanthomonas sacchari TaxID=56458 RepID=UPI003B227455